MSAPTWLFTTATKYTYAFHTRVTNGTLEIVKKYRFATQWEAVKEETFMAFEADDEDIYYYRSKSGKKIELKLISHFNNDCDEYEMSIYNSFQAYINEPLNFINYDEDSNAVNQLPTISYINYRLTPQYTGTNGLIYRAYSNVLNKWLYLMVNPATDEEQEPVNSPIEFELTTDPIQCY